MVIGLIVNTMAFLLIAELLPGFKVKNRATAVVMAIVYGILQAVCNWFLFAMLVGAITAMFALFPPLGVLAGMASILVAPIIAFVVSTIVLVATDKLIDDFEMASPATALVAALIVAVVNVITGAVLGV
jgi:putative membrane protein